MICADNINLSGGGDTDSVKESRETIMCKSGDWFRSKHRKTLNICSCLLNMMQDKINIKTTDRSFENVAYFIYLETTVKAKNCSFPYV
jgi:hypothetical protein